MGLNLLGILFTILSATGKIWSAPTDGLIVSVSAPECQEKGDALICDYKSSNQEPLYLRKLENQTIEKVLLYSTINLRISDDACVNVAIHNAKNITVSKSSDNACKKMTTFSATKSDFRSFHSRVNELYLEDCRVDELVLDAKISRMTIKKTDINKLNISGPIATGTATVMVDSHVSTLESFTIDSKSKITLQNSHIAHIKPKSLESIKGSLALKDVSFEKAELANLLMENFQGSLTFKGVSDSGSTTRDTVDSVTCQSCVVYQALFGISLILLIASWAIFIVLHKKELSQIFETFAQSKSNTDHDSKSNTLRDDEKGFHTAEEKQPLKDNVNTPDEDNEQEKKSKVPPSEKDTKSKEEKRKKDPTTQIDSGDTRRLQECMSDLMGILDKIVKTESDQSRSKDHTATASLTNQSISCQTERTTKDDSENENKLESLFQEVNNAYSSLDELCKTEAKILKISVDMRAFKINQKYPQVKKFIDKTGFLYQSSSNFECIIETAKNIVNKYEIELVEILQKIIPEPQENNQSDGGKTFKKSEKKPTDDSKGKQRSNTQHNYKQKSLALDKTIVTDESEENKKNYTRKINKKSEKMSMSYFKGELSSKSHHSNKKESHASDEICVAGSQLEKFIDKVYEMQSYCLRQYETLIKKQIQQERNFLLILVHIHITYADFLLQKPV